MELLPKEIAAKIPKLYETESITLPEKVAYAKFFHPALNWTWYVVEYDGSDTCFGLVVGHETEFSYFSLQELSQIKVGLPIERDLYFRPNQVRDLQAYKAKRAAA